ncbi:uncharacterized protein BO72DRAFT_54011 [Aspergillus fijiensis CBS 313.89]|uniref:Uncharacterized protein n=1 Tax=Aspergillus fijiensis CBS 313.89 TaxID=1448319 RepID=A0A8G1VZU5_9EURO|nr:uncharacterized protein BO72DRAFT_54011 [Aspergillus fijiensis CBS 313.89]RAK79170.1 hypothetical protein BO72DRAFT_54011 [Aspergillus fijiensis CBS 313.89]
MSPTPWWRNATIHQIYPASFQDSNGGGICDLPGIPASSASWTMSSRWGWTPPGYVRCTTARSTTRGYDIRVYEAVYAPYCTAADVEAVIAGATRGGSASCWISSSITSHTSTPGSRPNAPHTPTPNATGTSGGRRVTTWPPALTAPPRTTSAASSAAARGPSTPPPKNTTCTSSRAAAGPQYARHAGRQPLRDPVPVPGPGNRPGRRPARLGRRLLSFFLLEG